MPRPATFPTAPPRERSIGSSSPPLGSSVRCGSPPTCSTLVPSTPGGWTRTCAVPLSGTIPWVGWEYPPTSPTASPFSSHPLADGSPGSFSRSMVASPQGSRLRSGSAQGGADASRRRADRLAGDEDQIGHRDERDAVSIEAGHHTREDRVA